MEPKKVSKPISTKIDAQKFAQKVGPLLQGRLADALDLSVQAKQAHWNVRGPHFIGLHELFDQVHEVVEKHIDLIAERLALMGCEVNGTVRDAAKTSDLAEYPHGIHGGVEHCQALSTALAEFGKRARAAIDTADDAGDQDTADMFTDISREVDIQTWFVEAHLQAEN